MQTLPGCCAVDVVCRCHMDEWHDQEQHNTSMLTHSFIFLLWEKIVPALLTIYLVVGADLWGGRLLAFAS